MDKSLVKTVQFLYKNKKGSTIVMDLLQELCAEAQKQYQITSLGNRKHEWQTGEDNETYPSNSGTREYLDGITMFSTHKTL